MKWLRRLGVLVVLLLAAAGAWSLWPTSDEVAFDQSRADLLEFLRRTWSMDSGPMAQSEPHGTRRVQASIDRIARQEAP